MNKLGLLLFIFTTSLFASVVAFKPTPSYLTTLNDLRAAQWMINHMGDNLQVSDDEKTAVKVIQETIEEIKRVEHDNSKDAANCPDITEINERGVLLNKAEEYLQKACENVKNDTDDGFGNSLRKRTLTNISVAMAAIIRAKSEAE